MRFLRVDPRKKALVFLVVLALVAGGRETGAETTSGYSHDVDTVVRRIIDAYGGMTVLGNIHSFSATGVLESPLYERPAKYSVALEQQGRKLRVEIRSGSSFELRILNGAKGYYRTDASPIVAVSGSRLLAMVYQFKELTMLHQLMASSFSIIDEGKSTVNRAPVRIFLLSDPEGPPMKLYVDAKSHRIVRDSGIFIMEGAETELSSEFRDFKRVDGRLFPFRIINYAGGQRIGELHISEYKVNPALPDSLFMPGAAAGN